LTVAQKSHGDVSIPSRHPELDSGSINVVPQGEKSSLDREDLGGCLLFNADKIETHPRPLPNYGGEKRAAFTLAEVLITLAIIGVVAVMTIPTLISDYQEKVTVTKLKKMYSTLTNAYGLYKIENNGTVKFSITADGATQAFEVFKPYLRISQDCGIVQVGDCAYSTERVLKDNSPVDLSNPVHIGHSVILSDGSSIKFRSGADAIAVIYYDVNGAAGPNKWGHDYFEFVVNDSMVYPHGLPSADIITFDDYCAKSYSTGWGCAAWVIHKGNMDYLKCPDELTWSDNKCD